MSAAVPTAKDMTRTDWGGLIRGLFKFLSEEIKEPEHAEDDQPVLNTDPNGGIPASAPKGRAASILFRAPNGKVLFVKRSSKEENWPDTWSIPGGKAEDGEEAADAAGREAKEEVGDCSLDGMSELVKSRTQYGWDHTTFLVPAAEEFKPKLNDEHSEYQWASPSDAPQPLHPGVAANLKELGKDEDDTDFGAVDWKDPQLAMDPLTDKGQEILSAMKKKYGEKKGESVFYASRNKGTITGVDEALDGWAADVGTSEGARKAAQTRHLHMTATHEQGAGHGKFQSHAGSHQEVEHQLSSLHQHAKSSGGSYNVHIENKNTGEVHSAKVSSSGGVHQRSWGNTSLDAAIAPADAFLGPNSTYPVKEKLNGEWKYSKDLLSASARRARVQGRNDIARRADAITLQEFNGSSLATDAADYPITLTIELTKWDNLSSLIGFLRYVRAAANAGHGFTIEADREEGVMPEFMEKFGLTGDRPHVYVDGDGDDHIGKILLNGKDIDKSELAGDAALALDWRGCAELEGARSPQASIQLAFDRSSVREYDKDGRLHVGVANLSKAVVSPYWGHEIPNYEKLGLAKDRKYNLLRDPDEMAKGVKSFNSLPILSKHVPMDSVSHDPSLVIGSTGTDATFVEPFLKNSLVFWPQSAISDIEENRKKELSCAYHYDADMTPGTYNGTAYDGVMRNIVGNHLCLVKDGRVGPEAVVGDSALASKHYRFTSEMASPLLQ